MPVHDWSRVDAGIFHAFHVGWNWQLQEALNAGRLPPDYYSLVEQHAIEQDENSAHWIADLLTLHAGPPPSGTAPLPAAQGGVALADAPPKVRHVHVLVIELFPPGTCDPRGMHGAMGRWIDRAGEACPLPADEPLSLVSYRSVETPEAFIEHLAVGQSSPGMPLFFDPGRYVDVPLEATYNAAFAAMPKFWRERLII